MEDIWKGVIKVAVVLGYIGTEYRGSEFNPHEKTIEGELRKALKKIGAASWGKKVKKKYQWTRTSRTDSGVHAARFVISALLREESNCAEHDNELLGKQPSDHCPRLAKNLNDVLPPDIRVWDAVVVPTSFNARHSCSFREYKYFLPVSHLFDNNTTDQTTKEDLRNKIHCFERACKIYLGAHCYQNFTKVGKISSLKGFFQEQAKSLPFTAIKPRRRRVEDIVNDDKNMIAPCVTKKQKLKSGMPSKEDELEWSIFAKRDSETETGLQEWPLKVARELKTNIYDIFVEKVKFPIGSNNIQTAQHHNESWLSVTLIGNKFSYNQIRYMVGAAIMVARGSLSYEVFNASVSLRCAVRLPLAPAVGLVLFNSGYAYTDRTYSVAMDQIQMKKMNGDFNTFKIEEGQKNLKLISLVMSDEELKGFFENKIFPSIQHQWGLNNSRGMAEWNWHTFRLRLDPDIRDILLTAHKSQILGQTKSFQVAAKQKTERSIIRKELFCKLRNENDKQLTYMGKLWPTSFTAQLLAEFRMIPGNACRYLQLGLVEAVLNGHISPDADCKTLIAYVKTHGVDTLCRVGWKSRFNYFQDTTSNFQKKRSS